MLKRVPLYWWCQIIGWGSIIPYWLYYDPKVSGYTISIFVLTLEAMSQLLITDQYRRLVHRKKWLNRSLKALIPIVLMAWLALTAQYILINYTTFTLRYGLFFEPNVLLGMFAGGSRYHLIWLLAFHLYHFAKQSAEAAAAKARFAQLAAEAQLAKLKGELNPHFLFNALNSIKALTREDPAHARQAIDQLAGLLRYSFQLSDRNLVPLAEEIQVVRDYLALEQIRFEERLTVDWQNQLNGHQYLLPPLSLHTLVENAVKHGINVLPAGGHIQILLTDTPQHWQVKVSNSGSLRLKTNNGTGLANLRKRLRLIYGAAAHLQIAPATQEAVTVASIQLPK